MPVANALGDGLKESLISGLLGPIDCENVGMVGFVLDYSLDQSGQVRDMDCWH